MGSVIVCLKLHVLTINRNKKVRIITKRQFSKAIQGLNTSRLARCHLAHRRSPIYLA